MKRLRRMLKAWNEPQPSTIVINMGAGVENPAETGKAIAQVLLRYKRADGGFPLGLD